MAKTKYIPETVEAIVQALEMTGRDEDGWKAGRIGRGTFYLWQERHLDFKDKVAKAKKHYRDHLPVTLQKDATARLANMIRNGHEEQWFRKRVVRNGAGEIILTEETQSRVIRPPQAWVYDRIFGKGTQITDAIQVLLQEGVALPEQAEIVKRGLDQIDQELRQLSESITVTKVEVTEDDRLSEQ